ncbi:uncharacterized protein AMSG_03811 [Thecamonas trahens ATCC 50062]|uniref:Right handed beta helix domain-containing protein n=1 Tax=Thecamonas trahens ATCC 50062 TaxID=461836 RepID=A0A0L0D4T2_THETB|nr:hypothetical protein AMSG_03811 [Thecamonas trahens ATCC 50062]KNC47377.1 hypothetical protein AMSG_03811 [Thecamonas trahens ATCC 50062]|eukprot:XP_013759715.1 hypothetical protein AMSG_03811 [Thecamonas trahens ATCC 50062]
MALGACDAATLTVPTAGYSIQNIIAVVESAADGDIVEIGPGKWTNCSSPITGRGLGITLTLTGAGMGTTILDCELSNHILSAVPDFDNWTIRELTILRSGSVTDAVETKGGVILVKPGSSITFECVEMAECARSGLSPATYKGGAVHVNANGYVGFINSIIRDSYTSGQGGAITMTNGANVLFDNTTIANCSADAGGAMRAAGGLLIIRDGGLLVTGCTASQAGGILLRGATLAGNGTITLRNNVATTADGGGISIETDRTNGTIGAIVATGNSAAGCGGGVYWGNGAELDVPGGVVSSGNTAMDGGGICFAKGQKVEYVFLNSRSNMTGNTAIRYGGGVYVSTEATWMIMDGVTVTDNTADDGSGVFVDSGGKNVKPRLFNMVITRNFSPNGGALALAHHSNSDVDTAGTVSCGNHGANNEHVDVHCHGPSRLVNPLGMHTRGHMLSGVSHRLDWDSL